MPKVETQTLQLHVIPQSHQFQVRKAGTDDFHVGQMAEVYRAWVEDGGECPIPKPVLFKIGGVYHLVSGFNRTAAMKAAGVQQAEFEVHLGVTKSDAAVFAAESNLSHTALKLKKEDLKSALLMYYDNVGDSKKLANTVLAKKFSLHRETVKRYLEEHDAERKNQKDRVGADGRSQKRKAGDTKSTLFAEKPDQTDGEQKADDPMPVSTCETEPVKPGSDAKAVPCPEIAPARAEGEYPPDSRFMPNAADAEKISTGLSAAKAAMEKVRADMKRLFPDPQHPIASRLHFHTTFLPNLTAMVDDIAANSPTHTCPKCVGQTDFGGQPCRDCGVYGLVSAGDADEMKSLWKKGGGDLYDRLCREADLTEVAE